MKKSILLLALMTVTPTYPEDGFWDFFNEWSDFNCRMRNELFFSKKGPNETKFHDEFQDYPNITIDGDGCEHITNRLSTMPNDTSIRLSDLKGCVPPEIYDLKDFMLNSKYFDAVGAKRPRGILLVGPPGTGKTTIAKALAVEVNAPFISASGSDFIEMYVGVGAQRVRELFERAQSALVKTKAEQVIIFIDEIDAIGSRDEQFSNSESRQTINALLTLMDGFNSDDRITVIAATNKANLVDPALKRPGRFDYVIEVGLPNYQSRLDILKHYLHDPKYKHVSDANIDLTTIAHTGKGLSGAELKGIVDKAAILTARDKRGSISQNDIERAFNQVNRIH